MPDWKPDIRARLSSLSLDPAREAEIIEELTQHLDDRWHELMANGATPEEAARRARTEFSGARLTALLGTLQQAQWRDTPPPGQPRARWLDAFRLDLRHAFRALVATPSFTIGALPVLALGTGRRKQARRDASCSRNSRRSSSARVSCQEWSTRRWRHPGFRCASTCGSAG